MIFESHEDTLNWFEINDGSYLQLEQIDPEGEVTGTVVMTRSVALNLAKNILETFSEEYQ